jgi:uncharacterized membrane protein (GlpM family)
MLDTLLIIRLVLAFAVGGVWVSAVTLIAEKKGPVLGGVLGGFPSTGAFSFLFIAINQSTEAAVDATIVFPLAFAVTNAYLLFYAFFAKKGFVRGLSISFLIWFIAATLIVASDLKNYAIALAGGALISFVIYYLFARKLKLPRCSGQGKRYSPLEVVLRGVGAGALVAVSVLLSQIGSPILGGVAAALPAVFTSTLIILNRIRGTDFTRSITKPLVLSGIFTVIPYSITVHYLYPATGIWLGTLFAYMLTIPLAVLSYRMVKQG